MTGVIIDLQVGAYSPTEDLKKEYTEVMALPDSNEKFEMLGILAEWILGRDEKLPQT